MDGSEFALKPEGRYQVCIDEKNVFCGIFKGYSSLCGEVAMVIDPGDGKMRFIPISQIKYIDQLEVLESKEQTSKVDIYYR